jgi:hypothetical protein
MFDDVAIRVNSVESVTVAEAALTDGDVAVVGMQAPSSSGRAARAKKGVLIGQPLGWETHRENVAA